MGYLKAETAEGPDQEIVDHICPEIPDMGVGIHRGTAAVKAGFTRPDRLKNLYLPPQGIK
jgi:hypothetical protein